MPVVHRPTARLAAALAFALAAALPAQAQTTTPAAKSPHAIATFAGGCFWCMEPPFDKLDGVIATTSGYMGGFKRFPTYEQVSSGTTGHTEVVQIVYDPAKVSYEKLLEVYWVNTDPTVNNEQFCDSGTMYRPAIFTHTPEQKRAAEASKAALEKIEAVQGADRDAGRRTRASSSPPRSTTRTTTRRIRRGTTTTSPVAAATRG